MSKKFKWKQQLLDQTLHFFVSAIIVLSISYLTHIACVKLITSIHIGVVTSIAICLIREFIVQLPIERWWDTLLDTVFWILGAVFGGWISYVVFI